MVIGRGKGALLELAQRLVDKRIVTAHLERADPTQDGRGVTAFGPGQFTDRALSLNMVQVETCAIRQPDGPSRRALGLCLHSVPRCRSARQWTFLKQTLKPWVAFLTHWLTVGPIPRIIDKL